MQRWPSGLPLFLSLLALPAMSPAQEQAGLQPFRFTEPSAKAYRVEIPAAVARSLQGRNVRPQWIRAWPDNGSTNSIELGSRIILQLAPGADLDALLVGRPLAVEQRLTAHLFILRATDAEAAIREAAALAESPLVRAAHPDRRRRMRLHGGYAAKPSDPYFQFAWHLENRSASGLPLGVDLNVRAAWAVARGAGVVIAQADDGLELGHPDLTNRVAGMPHYNFVNSTASGAHTSSFLAHGTAVGGLAVAEAYNGRGSAGVAPEANLASWVIFNTSGSIVSDTALMTMFQYASNIVAVQNHSWGNAGPELLAPSLVEVVAVSNAWTLGRGGRGVVMCRAGGNGRKDLFDANEDGYANDPRVIAVGAVRDDGRTASYSSPGACLLVAMPSGDDGRLMLFTTDRIGSAGYNQVTYTNDLADYAFDGTGFTGTSGSTPLASGLAALILSANTNLTVRDVQQVMLLSARQLDPNDSSLQTNGAGFRVSHNTGFGVPDAGQAVALAKRWPNRPPFLRFTYTVSATTPIPDDGLRLFVTGGSVPALLTNIPCRPSLGPHADSPTASLPLADIGLALNVPASNLSGKAALIQRGSNFFYEKITNAALAGASFAVVYNRTNGGDLGIMAGTDFVPIPAVFIPQAEGDALVAHIATNPLATARIQLSSALYSFGVTNSAQCEHVAVRVRTTHPRRGDVRITLTSPSGTRSVMQRVNGDTNAGPADWTYTSVQHFYEPSAGTWTVAVSDELATSTGSVLGVDLTIYGVPILDTDNDGLDDGWELFHFGSLAQTAGGDPDKDGWSNAREQLMGTNPNAVDSFFQLAADLSPWNSALARIAWPANTNFTYELSGATNVNASFTALTNIPGRFPELEFLTPFTNTARQFFRLRAVQVP
jgi:subtilisin-like proprotein convertase family protein/subtilisin family serine protease